MTNLTVTDARARLAEVVNEARMRHDPVYLTRRGQRVAAVIDADDLDQLIAAAEDWPVSRQPERREVRFKKRGTVPWDQVNGDCVSFTWRPTRLCVITVEVS